MDSCRGPRKPACLRDQLSLGFMSHFAVLCAVLHPTPTAAMSDLKKDKDSTKQFQKERFGAFPPPEDNDIDSLDGPIDPSDPVFGSRMSSRDLPKTRYDRSA